MSLTSTITTTLDLSRPPYELWSQSVTGSNHTWDRFALARIKGHVSLVQVPANVSISPLTTVDVRSFRHEFINIFRQRAVETIHPADIAIIEYIDDSHVRYEDDTETAFLSKELMCRLSNLSKKPVMVRLVQQQQPVVPRTASGRYSTMRSMRWK